MRRFRTFGVTKKKGGLPYDAEVEYLKSTGTQYIDIGLDVQTDEIIQEFGLSFVADEIVSGDAFTGYYQTARVTRSILFRTGKLSIVSSATTLLSTDTEDDVKYDIYVAKGNMSISLNETVIASSTSTIYPSTYSSNTTTLFGVYGTTQGTIKSSIKCKCYYAKFLDTTSGDAVVDLIPVRVGSVGYMYDRVSGKMYGNSAGEGAFILGPDKGLPYDAEVEYLQGDGVAYIDNVIRFDGESGKSIGLSLEMKLIDQIIDIDDASASIGPSPFGIMVRNSATTSNLRIEAPSIGYSNGWGAYNFSSLSRAATILSSESDSLVTITYNKTNESASSVVITRGDGETSSASYTPTNTSYVSSAPYEVPLFCVKYPSGTIEGKTKAKIVSFYCQNLNTNQEVDMIPVRKDGVGYMYDKISGQLFGNAADSGAFIVGPDK